MAYSPYGSLPLARPRSHMGYGAEAMAYPNQAVYGNYRQPSYQIYGPPQATIPGSHRLTGPPYDDLEFDDDYGDERRLSSASLAVMPRHRRHSAVSYSSRHRDSYYLPGSLRIKFKRKRALMAGVSLAEAQDHRIRLSSNDAYTTHDLHADHHHRIQIRINWPGYPSMTYEIPLDGFDRRVSLQTLARRVSRACVHYLQANVIPVLWHRVQLHHLEEVAYGLWHPILSTR